MKINVEIDSMLKEPEVLIKTPTMCEEVDNLIHKISQEHPKLLVGFLEGRASIIEEDQVIKVYSSTKKVFLVTDEHKEYLLKIPLYEVIDRLNPHHFVRISNAEIVNLKKVMEFDLSFTGTICVKLTNGDSSYVSRRYVSSIKQILGIGGK